MKKKTPEILLPVGGVYRVPLRKVFKKRARVEGDATWNEIYGSKKCLKCKKPFQELDVYTVKIEWKKHSDGSESPIHRYLHVGCGK